MPTMSAPFSSEASANARMLFACLSRFYSNGALYAGVSENRVPYFWVLIIRILLFRVLYELCMDRSSSRDLGTLRKEASQQRTRRRLQKVLYRSDSDGYTCCSNASSFKGSCGLYMMGGNKPTTIDLSPENTSNPNETLMTHSKAPVNQTPNISCLQNPGKSMARSSE